MQLNNQNVLKMKTTKTTTAILFMMMLFFNALAENASKIYKVTEDGKFSFVHWGESIAKSKTNRWFEPITHPVTAQTFYYETKRNGIIPDDLTYREFLRTSHEDKRAMLNEAQLEEYFSMFEACASQGLYIDSNDSYMKELIFFTDVEYPYKNNKTVKRAEREAQRRTQVTKETIAANKDNWKELTRKDRKRWSWKNTDTDPDYYWMELVTKSGQVHQYQVDSDSPYLSALLEANQSNDAKKIRRILSEAGYLNYSAIGTELINKL